VRPHEKPQRSGGDIGVVPIFGLGAQDLETVSRGLVDRVTQVPFPAVGGVVAGGLEISTHTHQPRRIEAVRRLFRVLGHASLMGIEPGEHGSTPRHAQWVRTVGAGEQQASGGQPVHCRRMQVLPAHPATHHLGKLLVGNDEEKIRLAATRRRWGVHGEAEARDPDAE
jgi:hypothetical protein